LTGKVEILITDVKIPCVCSPLEPTTNFKKKMKLKDLPTPAFVINRHAMAKNCQAALDHATRQNFKIRPHIKTHKTMEGALLQMRGLSGCDGGGGGGGSDNRSGPASSSIVTGFVASTLPEVDLLVKAAKKHGEHPFHDILFGVPIAKSKLSSLDMLQHKLSHEGGRIHILIDHEQQILHIEEYCRIRSSTSNNHNNDNGSGRPRFSAYLKLDTGYHRAGVPCDHSGVQVAMRMIQSPAVELVGLYSHW
jgi:D-serine ammonia-lyase